MHTRGQHSLEQATSNTTKSSPSACTQNDRCRSQCDGIWLTLDNLQMTGGVLQSRAKSALRTDGTVKSHCAGVCLTFDNLQMIGRLLQNSTNSALWTDGTNKSHCAGVWPTFDKLQMIGDLLQNGQAWKHQAEWTPHSTCVATSTMPLTSLQQEICYKLCCLYKLRMRISHGYLQAFVHSTCQ